mmetsp:Transcript_113303/g.366473  ORF Transcript_113303/g.366473 Transcript_113303/m.366473 type:complete len:243 (-) Transcript_113303:55-783(-)
MATSRGPLPWPLRNAASVRLVLLSIAVVTSAGSGGRGVVGVAEAVVTKVDPEAPLPQSVTLPSSPLTPNTAQVAALALAADDFTLPPSVSFRNPEVWGPSTWFFLHSATLALPEAIPEERQASFRALMRSLQDVLPCPSCGVHLGEHMKEDPIDAHLATRRSLVAWMVALHNKVNRGCSKKSDWTVKEVVDQYSAAFATKPASRLGSALRGVPAEKSASRLLAPVCLLVWASLSSLFVSVVH